MEDQFKVGQLTKELVALRLKQMDDPSAAAADMVKQTVLVAVSSRPQDAEKVVIDACCGAFHGLILAEQELSRASILILEAIVEVSNDAGLDPGAMMIAALAGFAKVRRLVVAEQLHRIRQALEERFNGVGPAFDAALEKEPDPGLPARALF
jgi:hypothetical protein